MDFERIKEFIVLMESMEFNRAAKKFGLSNSTFSKHIKTLEEEIGVPLFIRTTRTVKPSEFGQLLYPWALELVKTQEKYTTVLKGMEEGLQLQIGISSSIFVESLANVILWSESADLPFQFTVVESTVSYLMEKLREKTCDIAFIRNTGRFKERDMHIKIIQLAQDCMTAILPQEHPLSKQPVIDIAQLRNESLLVAYEVSASNCFPAEACREAGFEPNIVLRSPTIHTILHLASRGVGVAILSGKPEGLQYFPNLVAVKIIPEKFTYVSCAYNESNSSPAIPFFLEHMLPKML